MAQFDRTASAQWGRTGVQTGARIDEGLRQYMLGVYNHMTLGLALTGLAAYATYFFSVVDPNAARLTLSNLTDLGRFLFVSPFKWVVIFAPLGLSMLLNATIDRMRADSARIAFLAFAGALGVSLSILLMVYTGTSVARVFFITAAAFAGLSFVGYTTKRDLSGMGTFLIMGVWGLIAASLVNVLLGSTGMQWVISLIGVPLFAGLTVYGTQMVKEMYFHTQQGYEAVTKTSIIGALFLYITFLNLFQSLLSLFGVMRSEE
jgi:uncharacterized protein